MTCVISHEMKSVSATKATRRPRWFGGRSLVPENSPMIAAKLGDHDRHRYPKNGPLAFLLGRGMSGHVVGPFAVEERPGQHKEDEDADVPGANGAGPRRQIRRQQRVRDQAEEQSMNSRGRPTTKAVSGGRFISHANPIWRSYTSSAELVAGRSRSTPARRLTRAACNGARSPREWRLSHWRSRVRRVRHRRPRARGRRP